MEDDDADLKERASKSQITIFIFFEIKYTSIYFLQSYNFINKLLIIIATFALYILCFCIFFT